MITASQFLEVWKNYVAPELNKHYEHYSNDPKWTDIILDDDIIETIRRKLEIPRMRKEDYKVDVVFCGQKNLIYCKDEARFWPIERLILFEHENNIDSVEEELYKLLYMRAPLKVIVTYQHREEEKEKLDERVEKYADEISKSNKWFPENPSTEYLWIIGRRNDLDTGIWWFAFVIDTKGKIEKLDITSIGSVRLP